jgi:hypothetical protein
MADTVSRKELYELVWAEPLREVAKRFAVSDVALKKACAKAQVPTPVQGHWNKVAAGKPTLKAALPLRPPGMSDEITIGGGGNRYWHPMSREELLKEIPPAPKFDETLEGVRARIESALGKVVCPRKDAQHPEVRRLLDQDEVRKRNALGQAYVFYWDEPRFDDPLERRRLDILNGLFLAIGRFGGRPSLRGEQARDISVRFDRQHVYLALDPIPVPKGAKSIGPRGGALSLRILLGYGSEESRAIWIDGDERLERQMTGIAAELVLTAEKQLREGMERGHQWRIERKAQLEEEDRQRVIEMERQERERQKKLERARIAQLLRGADDFRMANEIRAFVAALGSTFADDDADRQVQFTAFSSWALAQADRIDPALKPIFIDPVGELEFADEPFDADAPTRKPGPATDYWPRPWWVQNP